MGPANAVLVLMLLPNRVLAFGRSVALPSAVLERGPLPRLPTVPKLPLAFLGSILPIGDLAFLRSPALPIAPLALPMFPSLVFLGSMPLLSRFLPGKGIDPK